MCICTHTYRHRHLPLGELDEGAAKDSQPPGSHLGVLNFLLLKRLEHGDRGSPTCPRTSTFLSAQRPVQPNTAGWQRTGEGGRRAGCV